MPGEQQEEEFEEDPVDPDTLTYEVGCLPEVFLVFLFLFFISQFIYFSFHFNVIIDFLSKTQNTKYLFRAKVRHSLLFSVRHLKVCVSPGMNALHSMEALVDAGAVCFGGGCGYSEQGYYPGAAQRSASEDVQSCTGRSRRSSMCR